MLLNGFIFVFYFANSLPVMLAAQILEGIPWGVFIANSPAYCSEIVPIPLRAPATQMLQMFWAIGAIIVQGVTFNYNSIDAEIAYRSVVAFDVATEHRANATPSESLLPCSGCSLPLLLFSYGSHPNRLGG